MKRKKLMAVIAAATMAVTAMASLSFSASASEAAKDHYDTYRVYVDLNPASGMQQSYVTVAYRRYWFNIDSAVQGNVPGTIRSYGSAGDTWIVGVHYFDATADVTDGGTLYRQNFCTNYDTTDFWEIAHVSTNETKNSSGTIINPNPVTVSAVLVGDINKDNVVDWQDVSILNSQLSSTVTLTGDALRSADTNNDGYVNFSDLSMLINYANGTISNFLME